MSSTDQIYVYRIRLVRNRKALLNEYRYKYVKCYWNINSYATNSMLLVYQPRSSCFCRVIIFVGLEIQSAFPRRGLHRCFIPLRLAPPKGSTKGAVGGVTCMAGSQTKDSGLVFLGRTGVSVLQVCVHEMMLRGRCVCGGAMFDIGYLLIRKLLVCHEEVLLSMV